jgi:hypothetical protein
VANPADLCQSVADRQLADGAEGAHSLDGQAWRGARVVRN